MKQIFAVIGNPIAHSKSPRIHNAAIQALNLNAIYTRFHLTNAQNLREKIFELNLSGANITVPFKENALKIADSADEMAANIGSANTLLVRERKIHAYNTDSIGFLQAVAEFGRLKTALILGAGGTAKALAFVLGQSGVSVSVANRSAGRLSDFTNYKTALYENLQKNLDSNLSENSHENLKFDEILSANLSKNLGTAAFDIVINTTSAGLKDENLPCDERLLKALLSRAKCAFEVIYGKQTPFLRLAKSLKIPCKDGAEMLLWQGVFAFELFFGLCDENLSVNLAKFRDLNVAQNLQNLNLKQNSQKPQNQISQNLQSQNSAQNCQFLKQREKIFQTMRHALDLD